MRQKKYRIAAILLSMMLLISLSGCVSVNPGGDGSYKNGSITGKGAIASQEYTVEEYTAVKVKANVQLVYSAEASSAVKVEAYENLIEYLDISVENGTLVINSTKNFWTNTSLDNLPIVYISSTTLESVAAYEAIKFTQSDIITGGSFQLVIGGAGVVDVPVDVDNLDVNVSGAASLTFTGAAGNADMNLSGAGNIDAIGMATSTADITISGFGEASIDCSDSLSVVISGAGSLEYKGTPSVSQQISGAGSVKQVQ